MQMQHILLHPLHIYLPVKRTTHSAEKNNRTLAKAQ